MGTLSLFAPDGCVAESCIWRINGWPARILVWTADAWEALPECDRPTDAQSYPCGARVALRME